MSAETLRTTNPEQTYGRSHEVAVALQERGVAFTYTKLDSPAYEGLYELKHEQGENLPTVRLYRGVSEVDESVLDQVPYNGKGWQEDDKIRAIYDPAYTAMVERFNSDPSYTNLNAYANYIASTSDEITADRVADRLHKIENKILSGESLSDALVDAHISSRVGIGHVDISPYISTSSDPENAQRFGSGAVLVLNVPASQVKGVGEQGEVLVTGKISVESISAIAVKRSANIHYGIDAIVELFPPESPQNVKDINQTPEDNEGASASDIEAVSAVRCTQLLEATPTSVRESIPIPEAGPESYLQLQQSLFDYYASNTPDLLDQRYRGQLQDKDYKFDLNIAVLDRKTEPYTREKVTDSMLREMQREFQIEQRRQQRRAERLGRIGLSA
jgi:hypothetical protein